MRTAIRFASVLCLAAGLAACGDDTNNTDMTTADMTVLPDMTMTNPLIGTWKSEGSDVAPLLAGMPLEIIKIDAVFADLTYDVTATRKDMSTLKFSGTWTGKQSTVTGIWEITLNQAMPSTVTSQGIYKVDATATPNKMTYEVAQTQPPLANVTPPTAMAGFGSTSGGKLGMANVQKYVRVK